MGLTRSPPSDKECMVLAGNFINTAITQAKEIAKPLQINIKASDSVAKYSEILRRAPERITSWKASCARAGARMALSMVKAHYEDADIDTVTSGIPGVDDDGKEIDHEAILSSLAGYEPWLASWWTLTSSCPGTSLTTAPNIPPRLIIAPTSRVILRL